MTSDEAKAMLDKSVESLGEHFDSVSVLVTWKDITGRHSCAAKLGVKATTLTLETVKVTK